MNDSTYAGLVALAAGALLLSAVLVVWRRDLRAIVALLASQGAALAAIPLLSGLRESDAALIVVAGVVLALRAGLLPVLLARGIGADQRESAPLVNTSASLLITAALVVVAFAAARPVVALDPTPSTTAFPAALAVVLIALFTMAVRRNAISQAAGFLMLDNGIAASAFLLTAGVPLIVELGASLDVLFAIVVLGVLTGRLRSAFGRIDLDRLQELRD